MVVPCGAHALRVSIFNIVWRNARQRIKDGSGSHGSMEGFEQHSCSSLVCPFLWNVLTGAYLFTGVLSGVIPFSCFTFSLKNIYCYLGFLVSVVAFSQYFLFEACH
jgi:hypothetical protein